MGSEFLTSCVSKETSTIWSCPSCASWIAITARDFMEGASQKEALVSF